MPRPTPGIWSVRCQAGRVELFDELVTRGLVQDSTDPDALRARLGEGPLSVYYGCDPTSDSLHVGNLIGLVTLRRFQMAGHRPIALAGGATGMIGDPGGRSDERNLLAAEELSANVEIIRRQMSRFVDFDDPETPAVLVDNRDWTTDIAALEFLRDPGKHVTIQQMLAKESVRSRLDAAQGLSFTEFSYMLLQANDYAHLAEVMGCELQIGGADQWGNIALGVDLTRRRLGRRVHGLTWPLLLRADGTKYGKTAGGETMWLGAHRLSPYAFFQGLMQTDDADVDRLLAQLTFLSMAEVDDITAEHRAAPHRRLGQRRLAAEVTALVHGHPAARAAAEASAVLFGAEPSEASPEALDVVAAEVGTVALSTDELTSGVDAVEVAVRAWDLSRSEARRLFTQGGVHLNGRPLGVDDHIDASALLGGRVGLLRRGKKRWSALVPENSADRG